MCSVICEGVDSLSGFSMLQLLTNKKTETRMHVASGLWSHPIAVGSWIPRSQFFGLQSRRDGGKSSVYGRLPAGQGQWTHLPAGPCSYSIWPS